MARKWSKSVEPQQGEADQLGGCVMQFRADAAQEELVDFSHPMVGMLYFAPQLVIVSQQLRQFRNPLFERLALLSAHDP